MSKWAEKAKRREVAAAKAEQERQAADDARQDHRERYDRVADILEALGIDPVELRDYLAGPID